MIKIEFQNVTHLPILCVQNIEFPMKDEDKLKFEKINNLNINVLK